MLFDRPIQPFLSFHSLHSLPSHPPPLGTTDKNFPRRANRATFPVWRLERAINSMQRKLRAAVPLVALSQSKAEQDESQPSHGVKENGHQRPMPLPQA